MGIAARAAREDPRAKRAEVERPRVGAAGDTREYARANPYEEPALSAKGTRHAH